MLFIIKDIVTGKTYKDPYDLCEDMEGVNDTLYNAFRPDEFNINEDGDLIILSTCNDVYYLDNKRFKPLFNCKHPLLKNVIKYGV